MRAPKARGLPVDGARIAAWASLFQGYRRQVADSELNGWIAQFRGVHHDLAARVLDSVLFIGNEEIDKALVDLLNGLHGTGWHKSESKRRGRWRFVAFSSSPGESGDRMLHAFRVANRLDNKRYNELFILKSEIMSAGLTEKDYVVLLDDFSGSGDQACNAWRDVFQELLPTVGKVFLVLVAATEKAHRRISTETALVPRSRYRLTDRENVFSPSCRHFNSSEKTALLGYCSQADSRNPRGHGDCGLLLSFSHKCPNNTIPVLRGRTRNWNGLFR